MIQAGPAPRQRLDKWLWYVRLVKTRTLAQKLVRSGAVRVDSTRVTDPAHTIGPGAVLTVNLARRLCILKVIAPGRRRGPASEAATLFKDLSPVLAPPPRLFDPGFARRSAGSGRPTKKQRRDIERLVRRSVTPDGQL